MRQGNGLIEFPYPAAIDKSSVYYWWWKYLKRNTEYGPDHKLWDDFGDVSGEDYKAWFCSAAPIDDGRRKATHGADKWRGVYLFAEPEEKYPFIRIKEPPPEEAYTDRSVLLLQVPTNAPKADLVERFKVYIDTFSTCPELEDEDKTDRRGVRASRSSQARYPVVGQPIVLALEKTLAVYDFRLANPNMSLWEIWLALNPNMGRMIDPKYLTPEEVLGIPLTKASWTAAVSRYCKKAKAMIDNTGHGRFPDLSN